jgi:polysaccharide pyruvyl transferase WcaK-like protein
MERTYSKIGLLNHIGGGNLGDDATVDVVLDNVRRRRPDAVINAFSKNPDDTTKRHGIPSFPITTRTWSFGYSPTQPGASIKEKAKTFASKHKIAFRLLRATNALAIRLPKALFRELWFLARSRRIIGGFDLLIISGGGQLTEKDGPWAFPYTLFKWVVLAKSARVRCIVLNVGAGPLTHYLSKWFVVRALNAADYVSFRDAESQALVRDIGFTGDSQVFPDCVYSLEVPTPGANISGKQRQLIVGMGPIPYCDPRLDAATTTQSVYDDFIGTFAAFGAALVRSSYSLALFGTDIGVDPLAIEDVRTVLRSHHDVVTSEYEPHESLDKLLVAMSAMDYVVTCRFHGVIFAHLLNKPVLAISPHPKVRKLMIDLGLASYCVDIQAVDPTLLTDTFASLVSNSDKIKSSMATSLAKCKARLRGQFDELFAR